MEFRILGELEVRHDGGEVPISGMKQRKALAVLLLEAGRTVSMHRLIESLWEGEPPATARRQIRNIVASVRRHLAAADPIERSGDGYRLRTDAVDWHAFREEVARAKASGDHAESHRLLQRALQRWRGPVLAGLDGEPIASAAIGMEEDRLAACEDLYAAALALGRHREIIGEVRSLAAEHPYRQRLSGHLMLALYRSGDGPAALRVYADLSARLADELGVEPDRRLRELHVAILREDPALEPAPSAAAARGGPRPAEPAGGPARAPEDPAAAHRPAAPAGPEPSAGPAARDSARPAPRTASRAVAFASVLLMVGLGASQDGFDLLGEHEEFGPMTPSARTADPADPLWTHPALESGSMVAAVDAGLLVLDRSELRLEADGGVVWSRYLDAQAVSNATVAGDMIAFSYSLPGEEPWSTGTVIGIDLETGEDVWHAWNRWLVGVTGQAIITMGCAGMTDHAMDECWMESVNLRNGAVRWSTDLDDRSFPLRDATPYAGPWNGALTSDHLLMRSYPDAGDGSEDRLTVYDADTGARLSRFDYQGVEDVQVNDGLLMLHRGSTFVEEGRCEARVTAYELHSAELRWERFVDVPADAERRCGALPTLQGSGGLFPVTLGRAASVVALGNGELRWTAPVASSARLLADGALVAADAATDGIAVWDVWTRELRWTADGGELMWARGSTLWVLDRTAVGPGCGGVVGYALASGDALCLPGSLEYLTDDAVVTADDGTWRAWPADPWA